MNDRLETGRNFQSRPPAPRRILVVDDNVDVVETFVLLLRDMGHQAEFAVNGVGALATARSFRPEFVFLDLHLPGMDGYEVARRLKREPGLQDARIFALTGGGGDGDVQRGRGGLRPSPDQAGRPRPAQRNAQPLIGLAAGRGLPDRAGSREKPGLRA
jgi:CheY-like chemotaxis protein